MVRLKVSARTSLQQSKVSLQAQSVMKSVWRVCGLRSGLVCSGLVCGLSSKYWEPRPVRTERDIACLQRRFWIGFDRVTRSNTGRITKAGSVDANLMHSLGRFNATLRVYQMGCSEPHHHQNTPVGSLNVAFERSLLPALLKLLWPPLRGRKVYQGLAIVSAIFVGSDSTRTRLQTKQA